MADTGAPWNIPFAEPTDLVRDWPELSEDVALAVAAGLSAAGNPGIGSNVVQTVKTDVFTTSSSSFTTVTGMSVTITPTSATSKILLIGQVFVSGPVDAVIGAHVRFAGGNSGTYVGDADGSRIQAVGGLGPTFTTNFAAWNLALPIAMVYLDSPGTASPVTYSVEMRSNSGTATFNRSGSDPNNSGNARTASSITVIEVAA
jgi:hypothetical protein